MFDWEEKIQGVVVEPITIRLPRQGARCPWTGLSRSAMNDLVLPTPANNFQPKVRSKLLKLRENSTGIRLVIFESLKEYLSSE